MKTISNNSKKIKGVKEMTNGKRFKKENITVLVIVLACSLLTTTLCQNEQAQEPPIEFDQLNTIYRKDLTEEFGNEMAVQMKAMMGGFADMVEIQSWIYEVKEAVDEDNIDEYMENILEAHNWPENVIKTPMNEQRFGEGIRKTVKMVGDELNQVWGSDWTNKAEKAATKYENIDAYTKSYSYSDSTTNISYTITVNSPFGSLRTFQIYEGVYIIVTESKPKI
jgi:hypothetical protein